MIIVRYFRHVSEISDRSDPHKEVEVISIIRLDQGYRLLLSTVEATRLNVSSVILISFKSEHACPDVEAILFSNDTRALFGKSST